MHDLTSGKQLASRYTLVRRLGSGGGTQTWLAKDRLTRASVALKISVDPAIGADLLRREWQTSIRLVHAHIVRVFEFHDDPEGPFYSLQYVDGPDIGALAGRPLDEILPPTGLVADALAYAHGKSVVHRDVKASNVLLDAQGAPWLIDFGVAGAAGRPASGGSLIAASPQQLDGEPAAPADDIFALGGLVYELVSGRSPYSSADTGNDIRSRTPPPLTAADGSEVPAPLRELVASMLEKRPASRPDARTVVERLRAAGFPPGAAPKPVAGAAAARDVQVIEAGVAARRPQPAPAAAAGRAAEHSGLSPRLVASGLAVLLLVLAGVVFLLPDTVTRDGRPPEAAGADAAVQEEAPAAATDGGAVPERDPRVRDRQAAEEVLGRLLAKARTLEARAVDRWGGLAWKQGQDAYQAGDAAYLDRDYALAAERYAEAIGHVDPLLGQVDRVFSQTLADAERALERGDTADAVRLYELAVAISPSHGPSIAGLGRARNLDTVLDLTEQGLALERDLELDAARANFEKALEIDPQWQPASEALARVRETMRQMQFDARMTEGLNALAREDWLGARAAFRVAQELKPGSPEPADGLLQVDQGIRLERIAALQESASSLEDEERWETAAETYEQILELDADLAFAQQGLARARQMSALHAQLDAYIADPDSLSSPRNMQLATNLIVNITRMPQIGPRLESQRDDLSTLLKRAATPLTVELVSDNATSVSIYKVGRLGTFERTEIALKPGTYVAVGSRPGYRDVRLEFRVAPEIDMQPVVVVCEERI